MRLGQAARKFETSTDKLVNLLAKHFRTVNDHPNIKLTDEEVAFFEATFLIKADEAVDASQSPATSEPEKAVKETPIAEPEEVEATPQFVESLRPQVFTLEDEFTEKTKSLEKFKAEKPELEGLKVVGKIELPEPKPKVEKETKEKETRRQKPTRNRQPRGNSLAEQRKREERIAKRKKIEAEQREKELKRKYYEEQVKAKLQAQTQKKKKKKVQEPVQEQVKKQHRPRLQPAKKATGLKRIWLWLNGAYDKHD